MSFLNNYSKNLFINFLILIIPLTTVAGNLVLNLNILLLVFLSFVFFGREVFRIKYNIVDKLILIFFTYICLNGILNNFLNFDFPDAPEKNIVLIKSLLFMRYLLLYLVMRFLIFREIINIKLLFFVYGSCAVLISIDLAVQYFFGKNLLGMPGESRRLSGMFGDEPVAGAYIQKFFIFLPYAILFFSKIKNYLILQLALLLVLSINLFGILVSGNRMPLILSIFTLVLIFLFEKKLRILISSILILFLLTFSILLKTNSSVYLHFNSFKDKGAEFINYFQEVISKDGEVKKRNVYIKEFESGILTWQQNKFFGGGLKSFYFNCSKNKNHAMFKYIGSCNSHPHNYYIDIAASLGLLGLILTILIFSIVIIKSITIIYSREKTSKIRDTLIPFFIIFFVEVFPMKPLRFLLQKL